MHRSSIGRLVALVATALALVLAACGGDSKQAAGTNAGTPDPNATLTVAIPGDINDFDPHTNQLMQYQWAVRETVFDTLVRYDEKLQVVPGIATFEIDPQARVFTFALKDGVRFTDGTPVDARAVIASLERAARSKGIYAARLADVASYRAPDDATVVITLRRPNAAFLDGLALIAVLSERSFSDARKRPIGSGPYVLESWTPNSSIVLARNDAYWGEPGRYSRLTFKPVADEQVALNDLYAGSVDVVGSVSTAAAAQLDRSRAKLVEPPASNSISIIEMAGRNGKVADLKLRQGLAHAFDHDAVQKVAYGGFGDVQASPLPVTSWAYAEQPLYDYDLDKARALIDEAGAAGTSLTLDIVSGYPEAQKLARVWQQSLKEVGIDLKIRSSEISVWLDRYVNHDYDVIWNIFSSSSDPDSFFDIVLKPSLATTFRDAEMERLIAKAVATSDQDARAEIYAQLQAMVVERLPVMMVQTRPVAAVAASGVDGIAMNPLGWPLLEPRS